MKYGFVKVAAAIPGVKVADCKFNAQQIDTQIAIADGKGVQVIVFPELCITGYSCADLFGQTLLLEEAEIALMQIMNNTRQMDIISIVGMPIAVNSTLLNCAVAFQKGKILGVVPKTYLPNHKESSESRWFSPAFVIKGSFASSRSGRILRYTLVGVQYVISISLIICAIFIREQHQFMLNKDMGFDQAQLLSVDIPLAALAPTQTDHSSRQLDYTRRDAFSDRIKQHPMISDIAFGDGEIVAENRMGWGRSLDGKEVNVQIYPVSWNFLEMMGIEVTEGRNFTPTDELCENGVIIFNEEAKRQFNVTLESKMMAHVSGTNATIAGFCENFNYKPAQFAVEPFAFIVYGIYGWALPTKGYVRTMPGADITEVCRYIHNTIMEFAPNANPESCKVKLFMKRCRNTILKRISSLHSLPCSRSFRL